MTRVTLRYFPIVGRAQPLRHALVDAGVAFDDIRVPLGDWPARRGDPAFAGLFAALPSLSWDADTVSEALAIASYLARRLGQYDGLDDGAIGRLEAVASVA